MSLAVPKAAGTKKPQKDKGGGGLNVPSIEEPEGQKKRAEPLSTPLHMQRRKSYVPDDEEEVSFMFATKPVTITVTEGKEFTMECMIKKEHMPSSVQILRGSTVLGNDPRQHILLDKTTGNLKFTCKKSKSNVDEAKYKINLLDENKKTVDFAGFSVFVKDPNDSGMDFRNMLKHKDTKKRKGVDEGPDINLKHLEKAKPEFEKGRRGSMIGLLKPGGGRRGSMRGDDKPDDHWIVELIDKTVPEKEPTVTLTAQYSKAKCKLAWTKNKLEIFQGAKYRFVNNDGTFKLVISKVTMADAGTYVCMADTNKTACEFVVEADKINYFFS